MTGSAVAADAAASLSALDRYVRAQDFAGWDPYDTLNAGLPLRRMGKWIPILATQVQKRNPVNLRRLLGVRKGRNPKGIGLFLHGMSLRYALDPDAELRRSMDALFAWLLERATPGYSGYCWGYDFDWASPVKVVPAYHPSVVVTSFVAQGIHAYHEATGEPRAAEVVRSACRYVMEDLPVTETPEGICISYTDIQPDICYNASLLGAELLARGYALGGESELRDRARAAVAFVVRAQHADGHWAYSRDLQTGRERPQVDFHQGFVLDSLHHCIRYAKLDEPAWTAALHRGAGFYRERQFHADGRSRWRLPGDYPADIHHQAQGILTFTRLAALDSAHLPFARRIAAWTIDNMRDRRGYFHYRRYRWFTNRIPFMRWGQAWMYLALATLLNAETA